MPAQATTLSAKELIAAAKAPILAYGEKNWEAMKAACTTNFVYDEIATGRKVEGIDKCLSVWKSWATAFPDSKATFHEAHASASTVIVELSWHGTNTGPLELPSGPIAATGKKIDIRACIVVNMVGDKAASERQYFDMATMFRQLGLKG